LKRPGRILLVSSLLAVLSAGSAPPAGGADNPAPGAQPVPRPVAEIRGEVAHPGTYALREGETLSSLILRAGGYTDNAWLPGAALTRESEKIRQGEELAGLVRRLETATRAAGSEEAESGPMRRFLDSLRELSPAGRVPVRLSHPRLMINSPEDLPLTGGDVLSIPSAPRAVRVTGAVRDPGEYPPSPGARLSGFAASAGGILPEADGDGTILLKADGTARMLSEPWIVWNKSVGRRCTGSLELVALRLHQPFPNMERLGQSCLLGEKCT